MIMIMNRYQTIISIDKAKVVTKQQNLSKTKLKIKQYNMDVYSSQAFSVFRIKKRNLTTNIRASQLLTNKFKRLNITIKLSL